MAPNMQKAALAWASRLGVRVFPVWPPNGRICSCPKGTFCNSPGKHPLTPNGWKDGTVDTATIKVWWTLHPNANIGLVTGATSNLVVVDVDPKHDGDATLRTVEREHEPLPQTRRVITGSLGEHIMFKHPGGTLPGGVGKVGPGVDLCADGQYVVGPPSLHASGRRYCFDVDHHPSNTPLADMPVWLLERLRLESGEPGQNGAAASAAGPKPPEFWAALVTSDVPEGKRNATVAQLAGHLLSRVYGHDPYFALEVVQMFNAKHCKPPLGVDEVAAVVRNISAAEEKKIHVLKAGSR